MKCVFISCFNAYDDRIAYIEEVLKTRGYKCTYITSNFDHIEKKVYSIDHKNAIQINVIPYQKNFSFKRLLSHFLFSKAALKEVRKIKPDILYVMLPPNSLALFSSNYKKKNKNTKLIFDLYDLWPETFPSERYKHILSFAFKLWGSLRNSNLKSADSIVTECDLFKEKLERFINKKKSITLYPAKKESQIECIFDTDFETINICYLGSINNIIDINGISRLLQYINEIKPVTLHIIGDGEKRVELIESVQNYSIKVRFYGKIYDNSKKQDIFNQCCFGLNMMKNSVCVGLTLKSIDYIQAGLPLLNNITADTFALVKKYAIGINVDDDMRKTAEQVTSMSFDDIIILKKNTKELYHELFTIEAFKNKVEKII